MKASKKFWPLLISFFAAGIVIVLACAGGEWDETEGSMFTPEIINKPKYEPFFRSQAYPLYTGYNEGIIRACNETNTAEWKTFFEDKVTGDQLNYWLNRAEGKEIGAMLLICKGKKGTIDDSSKKFSLAEIQPADKVNAFLFYLGFAKRNETFACTDGYGDEKENPNAPTRPKQIEGGLKLYANAKTDFMKERYVFQLVRLYYFNQQYAKADSLYEKSKELFKTGNSMKWRTMGYAAAANYKLKNFSQANYYFSLIYDGFAPHRNSAYLSFHPQNDKDWEACLKLTKNTREKTVLWHLFGIYFDPARAMKEIYMLDPASDLLDLLLVRAINIEEEKSGGPQIIYYSENDNKPFSLGVDEKLFAVVNEIAGENRTSNDPLWDLAAAHLNYSNRNFVNGDKFLKEAQKAAGKKDLFASQYLVVSLVGKLNRETKLTESVEKKILPEIKTLYEMNKAYKPRWEDEVRNPDEAFRSTYAVRWVRNTLAVLYARDRQFEKAEMIQPRTIPKYFDNKTNIKKMIAYFDDTKKTELETFFIKQGSLTLRDYYELLGIRYAQEDKLDSSLLVFKKIENACSDLKGNPFNIRIKDCHDCDHAVPLSVPYNSATFIGKMLEMKNKAKANKKEAATNYFLLANGFYNMTYYGNARFFYANGVSGETGDFSWSNNYTEEL
ncbi:MAG: hypothetical protein IAF38_22985, partial [Bacteroidia bacterium]|nr:hypothetical protein [Bacteroidia bacterium]